MGHKIKCVLLDDEPLQLKLLKQYCEDHLAHLCSVVKVYSTSGKFLDDEKKLDYDLLMSDIDMDGLKGTEIARLISKPVVFVSGRDSFDKEVLDLQFSQDNIITLIRKPIDKEKIEKAFAKFNRAKQKITSVVFSTHSGLRNFSFADILIVTTKEDAFKKGILQKNGIEGKFHPRNKLLITKEDVYLLMGIDFDELNEKLPSSDFFQISKSTIIAKSVIENFNTDELKLKGDLNSKISTAHFNVSPDYLKKFKIWYKK